MGLVAYYLVISITFALLSFTRPRVAEAFVVGFIGLLLIPAFYFEAKRARRRHRHHGP